MIPDDLVRRVMRSPFYRERLGARWSGDPATLPLTRREDLVRDQLAHPPLGTRRPDDAPPPVRAGISGTSDSLLVLAWSEAELARERAAGVRLLRRLGVEPGMRVANTLPGALATPGSLLLGDVVEELGALDVPLGAVETEAAARQAWDLVDRVRPDVLVLADAGAFLRAAPPAARPWWRGTMWLHSAAAPPPTPAAAGFAGWEREWLAVPEATSFVASTCTKGVFHVDQAVVAEIVDPQTGALLPSGQDGFLVISAIGLDAPLARFATGLTACAAACACGAEGLALTMA